MATPRLDDANIEFQFTEQEAVAARILDPLKIMWLQTRYAKLWKMKNSMTLPEEMALDRSYIMKIVELDGRMNAIQELLDDHKTAQTELQALNLQDVTGTNANSEVKVAQRAGDLVHIQTP